MSEHKSQVRWVRESDTFDYESYNREHDWIFENGLTVRASSAPGFLGSPECVDPEEAFVASLSSCHMLTFLAICAKKKMTVESYDDNAVGFLETQDKKLKMTRVVLRPRVVFGGDKSPDAAVLARLHESAHRACFIANSVTTEITMG